MEALLAIAALIAMLLGLCVAAVRGLQGLQTRPWVAGAIGVLLLMVLVLPARYRPAAAVPLVWALLVGFRALLRDRVRKDAATASGTAPALPGRWKDATRGERRRVKRALRGVQPVAPGDVALASAYADYLRESAFVGRRQAPLVAVAIAGFGSVATLTVTDETGARLVIAAAFGVPCLFVLALAAWFWFVSTPRARQAASIVAALRRDAPQAG
jgi:hypothetical protein